MSEVMQKRKELRGSMPPRHMRGCPRNVLRSVMWHLTACAVTPDEFAKIIMGLRETLPCHCPKKPK